MSHFTHGILSRPELAPGRGRSGFNLLKQNFSAEPVVLVSATQHCTPYSQIVQHDANVY